MSELDRNRLIDLLERLGAKEDEQVLAAAREVHAYVSESGFDWDELLEPDDDEFDDDRDIEDEEEAPADEDDDADEDDEADEDEDEAAPEPAEAPPPPAELEEDAKLIDRLLARKGLGAETRSELNGLKADIAAGEFTAMDSRYVRALAKRLDA